MSARGRLLDAGVDVVRANGLAGTTVDDLCSAAGVTKGAFFHHFDSKEVYAAALADHWSETTGAMFSAAEYHDHDEPLDRVMAYVDLRESLIVGEPQDYACVAGTMVQEAFHTSESIRDACGSSILGHAATLEADFSGALAHADPTRVAGTDALSLARFTQTVVQGAFITSKAADDPQLAIDSIAHLRRYLQLLLSPADASPRPKPTPMKRSTP